MLVHKAARVRVATLMHQVARVAMSAPKAARVPTVMRRAQAAQPAERMQIVRAALVPMAMSPRLAARPPAALAAQV